jgi:hypothetical protein
MGLGIKAYGIKKHGAKRKNRREIVKIFNEKRELSILWYKIMEKCCIVFGLIHKNNQYFLFITINLHYNHLFLNTFIKNTGLFI